MAKFFALAVFVIALVHLRQVEGTQAYVLEDNYSGSTFFDAFYFQTADYNHCQGAANFTTLAQAKGVGLLSAVDGQPVRIGVEHTLVYGASGRPTVTIVSNKAYNGGLFIGDFVHIPTGCGTWPAWWTVGPNWPNGGEIDIIEGVQNAAGDQTTLHTQAGCGFSSADQSQMTGSVQTTTCGPSSSNSGCGVVTAANSFGTSFNSNGGGVFAMEWQFTQSIKSWFWPHGSVPADVTSQSPDPSTWGQPYFQMTLGSNCPSTFFANHNMIIDTFLCGDWAGNVWSSGGCATSTGVSSCVTYAQTAPSAFAEAYWSINSIKVYQLQNVSPTSSSTASSSPTSSSGGGGGSVSSTGISSARARDTVPVCLAALIIVPTLIRKISSL